MSLGQEIGGYDTKNMYINKINVSRTKIKPKKIIFVGVDNPLPHKRLIIPG